MKSIFISGKASSGKTAVAMPLALKLKEEGYRVSYFKPQGYQKSPGRKDDDDIQFMKEVLQLKISSRIISPVILTQFYLSSPPKDNLAANVKKMDESIEQLSSMSDVVLIEGSINPYLGGSHDMDDFSLARRWESALLHIFRADDDFEFDSNLIYLSYSRLQELPLLGCIFNNTSESQWDITGNIYKNIVEKRGANVLGILPRRTSIASPTVLEFLHTLNGELLTGKNNLDRRVENISVGTMTIESALSYLRRSPNKAVITGGDRSDMALTALETSTSVLILTGGLYPDIRVISRAEEKGVPVILVHHDTFTTVENLHGVYRTINPRNKEAIRVLKEDLDKYVDFEHIKKFMGS